MSEATPVAIVRAKAAAMTSGTAAAPKPQAPPQLLAPALVQSPEPTAVPAPTHG